MGICGHYSIQENHMRDDLKRIYENPEWKQRASSNNWNNQQKAWHNQPSYRICKFIYLLNFIFRTKLTSKRPEDCCTHLHFFIRLAFEVINSPEGDRQSIKLETFGNFSWILEVKLNPYMVFGVFFDIPRELEFLRSIWVLGSDGNFESIDELQSIVHLVFFISYIDNIILSVKFNIIIRLKVFTRILTVCSTL